MKIIRFTQFLQRFALGFALLCANLTFAEESGVFLGANVGYGDMAIHTDTTAIDDSGYILTQHKDKLINGGGVNYGIITGYKQFFTPHLGLRYYVSFSALHATLSPNVLMEQHAGINTKQKITLLNYGANVDFLGNFIANNAFDFGAFVGVGIGADSLLGADLDNYTKAFVAKNQIPNTTWSPKRTHFGTWANLGLRANLAKYHSVEIFAQVPFVANAILQKRENIVGAEWSIKTTITNHYNISIRYGFSF